MLRRLCWTILGLTSRAAAACTRESLQDAAAKYLKAQAAGTPSLLPLSPNVSYVENDAPVNVGQSLLVHPITIDFSRSLFDTDACATFTELTAATNNHPYVVATKLLLKGDKIINVESVVADDGDWLFNATSHLSWTTREIWDPIPPEKQDTRAVIKAAGDAYLDNWGNVSIPVPYGVPCARLEGGLYTGSKNTVTNTCTMGAFPEPLKISRRTYAVDRERGGLAIFNEFPFIDKIKPNGTASVNFFRVEQGKIRYIHETTICATRNCGR